MKRHLITTERYWSTKIQQSLKIRFFLHKGRIGTSRIGIGKKAELRALISKLYPEIPDEGDRHCLGGIKADHLLRLDESDVINLIINLLFFIKRER